MGNSNSIPIPMTNYTGNDPVKKVKVKGAHKNICYIYKHDEYKKGGEIWVGNFYKGDEIFEVYSNPQTFTSAKTKKEKTYYQIIRSPELDKKVMKNLSNSLKKDFNDDIDKVVETEKINAYDAEKYWIAVQDVEDVEDVASAQSASSAGSVADGKRKRSTKKRKSRSSKKRKRSSKNLFN